MSKVIKHFRNPSLFPRKGNLYFHSYNTMCGKYIKEEWLVTKEYSKVSCAKCLDRMSCIHSWRIRFTDPRERDIYWICKRCEFEVKTGELLDLRSGICDGKNYIDIIWNSLSQKNQKILIFSNFRLFNWPIV